MTDSRSYPDNAEAIVFWYKNYKGEQGYRCAVPISMRYGTSDYHHSPQWLMLAFDTEKQAEREFAMSDMSHNCLGGEIKLSLTAPAQTVLAPDHVAVPKAALDWLFGQGPDDKGWLLGECSEAQKAMNTKNPRRYWWRAKFRTMLSAVPSTMPLPAAPQPVAWRWREITSAPDDWHYQAIEPRFINPPHFIVEPLSALTSTEEK